MGYSINDSMVRVDFFKPSGKWYTTEAIEWINYYGDIIYSFHEALKIHFKSKSRYIGFQAICLEPCHEHSHPISIIVKDYSKE